MQFRLKKKLRFNRPMNDESKEDLLERRIPETYAAFHVGFMSGPKKEVLIKYILMMHPTYREIEQFFDHWITTKAKFFTISEFRGWIRMTRPKEINNDDRQGCNQGICDGSGGIFFLKNGKKEEWMMLCKCHPDFERNTFAKVDDSINGVASLKKFLTHGNYSLPQWYQEALDHR